MGHSAVYTRLCFHNVSRHHDCFHLYSAALSCSSITSWRVRRWNSNRLSFYQYNSVHIYIYIKNIHLQNLHLQLTLLMLPYATLCLMLPYATWNKGMASLKSLFLVHIINFSLHESCKYLQISNNICNSFTLPLLTERRRVNCDVVQWFFSIMMMAHCNLSVLVAVIDCLDCSQSISCVSVFPGT